jgi:antitoxin YefM
MTAIYRLNANEIDAQFLDEIKAKFCDKQIEIVISELDETEYLLSSKANKEKLLVAIEDFNNGRNLIEVNLDNFL